MSTNPMFDLVYIGNYTKDTIISPAGTRFVDGGAVNYAAHTGACLGFRTAAVVHLAEEDRRVIDGLEKAGVTCFPTFTPDSTCVRLEYPTADPDIRNLYVTSTARPITAEDIEQITARTAVVGTTLRGEVGLDVFKALDKRTERLAADVQGFVRVLRGQSLVYEPWDEMAVILPYLDILKSDAVEAEFLTGEKDIYRAARVYHDLGAREIVLTHRDGVLVYTGELAIEAGFKPRQLIGRSGRGDTCLGTYAARRLTAGPEEATVWAAAVTSLKMEKLCPIDRTVGEIEEFIEREYRNENVRVRELSD